jgi:DNA ligase-1
LKVREDKSIDEATTSDYLALLWRKQGEKVTAQGEGDGGDGGDGGEEQLGWQEE